ncbi:MAG: hypothetical protein IPK19_35195 [Chloroflexi bacterium]|nr:hypothetical protein [Chloroflexota bacterium]
MNAASDVELSTTPSHYHVLTALIRVMPVWLSLCVISVFWGVSMEMVPGVMEGSLFYPNDWAANLAHFDPNDYLLIAEQGYSEGIQSVRFPLFPFLLRMLIGVTNLEGYVALFVLSKLFLLVGMVALWMLARHLWGMDQAQRVVLYTAFPLLGSGYTWLMSYAEPLYLALWASGFLLLFRRKIALAGLVAVLTVWVRPQAVLQVAGFAVVLAADVIQKEGWRGLTTRQFWRDGLLACGLPLLAYTAWMLRISHVTQLPLSPMTAVQAYGRVDWVPPWDRVLERFRFVLNHSFSEAGWTLLFEDYQLLVALLSLCILIVLASRRRLPWGLVVFTALSILPGLSSSVTSVGRYALLTAIPIAPVFIIPRRLDAAVLPVGLGPIIYCPGHHGPVERLAAMKVTREEVLTVVLASAVLLIGIAMFAFAGQEMSDEARAATTWSNALCEGDMDTLLWMAAVDVEADVFAGWTASFLASGEIPQPCTARVNLNLVRAAPVPDSLRGSIDRVRLFGDVAFTGTRGQVMTMPLWLYHRIGGEWKVWAGYFGATTEQGADPGELARLTDRNGLLIGMARVIPPVRTFQAENRTLIAVEMSLQTLSQPWEWYGTQLLAHGRRARPVENADQLPEEWRAGFANANGGGYVPQNLEQIVTFWFAADAAQPSPGSDSDLHGAGPQLGHAQGHLFRSLG